MRRRLAYGWVVLASGVTGGLLYTLLDSSLPATAKLIVLTTTFVAWAGGIATAWLIA